MVILSKKILIAIHGNIHEDLKKYVLTNAGMDLINEIASFVKRNFQDFVVYSSAELITLLTAKAIYRKTKIRTEVEKELDNNKRLFSGSQLDTEKLINVLFIDKDYKSLKNVDENEALLETFLRVKKTFKGIISRETKKNIVFVVCRYVGECILHCLNEYTKYDYNDDVYMYSIKYKKKKISKRNYRIQIVDSSLIKSAHLLKKTFYKLKREKKLTRKFSLFNCCFVQYPYVHSEEEEEIIPSDRRSLYYSSNTSNTYTVVDSVDSFTKEYYNSTFQYDKEELKDTFLYLDDGKDLICEKGVTRKNAKQEIDDEDVVHVQPEEEDGEEGTKEEKEEIEEKEKKEKWYSDDSISEEKKETKQKNMDMKEKNGTGKIENSYRAYYKPYSCKGREEDDSLENNEKHIRNKKILDKIESKIFKPKENETLLTQTEKEQNEHVPEVSGSDQKDEGTEGIENLNVDQEAEAKGETAGDRKEEIKEEANEVVEETNEVVEEVVEDVVKEVVEEVNEVVEEMNEVLEEINEVIEETNEVTNETVKDVEEENLYKDGQAEEVFEEHVHEKLHENISEKEDEPNEKEEGETYNIAEIESNKDVTESPKEETSSQEKNEKEELSLKKENIRKEQKEEEGDLEKEEIKNQRERMSDEEADAENKENAEADLLTKEGNYIPEN